jgi:cytosine/adenosine deaminase-related metal-dependent hydrolase
MADLIVAHGFVITMDDDRRMIEDGAVAIEQDRIVAVGPSSEILARHQAREVIDASRKAVIPGLVDAHAHAGHGLIKTLGAGDSDAWYRACELAYTVASTPEFWHAEAQLAALERLKFGVTAGVSLLGGGDTVLRTDDPAHGDAHCEGVAAVGTRSLVAIGPTRPPHPRTYARWNGDESTRYPVDFATQMRTCETLIGRWHGSHGQRLNIALITPTLREEHARELSAPDFAAAKDQAVRTQDAARAQGLIFTQDGHHKGSVAFARELGILGANALLSHATDLTDDEIRICADTGTMIAHNPSAIASVLGRCPAIELMRAGVTVALGSDATAPDRSADMFRHMQQCLHYHRRHFRDPDALRVGRALQMCTRDGAKALGLEKEIGALEKGRKADITIVDLARPHLYPANMPLFRLVCFANGNDVHTVIVDGKVALQDRKPVFVDEEKILDAAQRECALMLRRAGVESLTNVPRSVWG